MILEIQLLN